MKSSQPMTTVQTFLLFCVGVLLGLAAAYFLVFDKKKSVPAEAAQTARVVIEPPREILPMQDMQSAFTRQTFESVDQEGVTHKFTYHSMGPQQEKAGVKYPLVVVLHGAPGRGYAAQYLAHGINRQKYPAFVLVPVMPRKTLWAFPQQVEEKFKGYEALTSKRMMMPYVMEMIEEQVSLHPIDQSRIYVIGCSEGGFGAFGAAMDHADIFAAAVSLSGGWDVSDAGKLGKIPLKVVHGALDENVLPEFSSRIALKAMAQTPLVSYEEIANMGHECPNEDLYKDTLWRWLFAQKKTAL